MNPYKLLLLIAASTSVALHAWKEADMPQILYPHEKDLITFINTDSKLKFLEEALFFSCGRSSAQELLEKGPQNDKAHSCIAGLKTLKKLIALHEAMNAQDFRAFTKAKNDIFYPKKELIK